MAKLTAGFILACRCTLYALANCVDVQRLQADEDDRSWQTLCGRKALSPTIECSAA